MKIHDVTLTLFAWANIPPTTYGRHTGRFEGSSELGLLTLRTDEGHEGHAFLGSAQRSAHHGRAVAAPLPQAAGARPGSARPGAAVAGDVAAQPRDDTARDRRDGRGAVGSRRQDRWSADPPAARLLPRPRAGLRVLGGAAVQGGLRRGGRALQGRRLERLQDPSAHRPRDRHQGVRGGATRGRRRLHDHAGLDVGLSVPGGAAGGQGGRGAGLLLVRGSAGRRRSLQLREAQAAAVDSDPRHRVRPGRLHRAGAVDHVPGHRLPARRRGGEGRDHRRS